VSTPRPRSGSSIRACRGAVRGGRRSTGSGAVRSGSRRCCSYSGSSSPGLLAKQLAPYPAGEEFLEFINKPQPPFHTPHQLLGTDVIGHDFLTQLLFGIRESVFASLVCAGGATLIGAVVGAVAGYYGGVIDAIVTWATGAVVSLLAVAFLRWADVRNRPAPGRVCRLVPAHDPARTRARLGLVGVYSRYVRSAMLVSLNQPYAVVARAKGLSEGRVVVRHALRWAAWPAWRSRRSAAPIRSS
jgi:peptide/nickel transport system permease protein